MAVHKHADPAPLKQAVLEYIHSQGPHLPVHTLSGRLCRELGCSRRSVKQALKALLDEGRIAFTSRLGSSFIEPSYQVPVRMTPRLWIAQPGQQPALSEDDTVVYIASGDAFGDGRHPTTRLALNLMDQVLGSANRPSWAAPAFCLDVGCGSGILALAALALGMDGAWGVDPDPCARSETAANARSNGMEDRLRISGALPSLHDAGKFQLIAANLRLPTLCRLARQWRDYRREGAWLVISGIRETEIPTLIQAQQPFGWIAIQEKAEDGWAAVAFHHASRNRPGPAAADLC